MNFQYCGPWKMQICKLSSNFPEEEKFEKEKNISFPAHYSDAVAFENLQGRNVF